MIESWTAPPGISAVVRSTIRILATWEGTIAAVPDGSQYVNVGAPGTCRSGPTIAAEDEFPVTVRPDNSLATKACPSIMNRP